jgi:hypothetical protein
LRSSIPHSHPHTKLAGCHLLFLSSKFWSFFLLSQPRRKRLSFDSSFCVGSDFKTPHKKKKVGFQSFWVSQNIFSLSALWVSGAKEREREGWWGKMLWGGGQVVLQGPHMLLASRWLPSRFSSSRITQAQPRGGATTTTPILVAECKDEGIRSVPIAIPTLLQNPL